MAKKKPVGYSAWDHPALCQVCGQEVWTVERVRKLDSRVRPDVPPFVRLCVACAAEDDEITEAGKRRGAK